MVGATVKDVHSIERGDRMGDIADYYGGMFCDGDEEPSFLPSQKQKKTCYRCGAIDLEWHQFGLKWRLIDKKEHKIHVCEAQIPTRRSK